MPEKKLRTQFLQKKNVRTKLTNIVLITGCILIIGLGLTGFYATKHYVEKQEFSRFNGRCEDTAFAIQSELEDYGHLLANIRGFFAGSESVTESEWHKFIDALSVEREYPSLKILCYSHLLSKGKPTPIYEVTYVYPKKFNNLKQKPLSKVTRAIETIDRSIRDNQLIAAPFSHFEVNESKWDSLFFLSIFPNQKVTIERNPTGIVGMQIDMHTLAGYFLSKSSYKDQLGIVLQVQGYTEEVFVGTVLKDTTPLYSLEKSFEFGSTTWNLRFVSYKQPLLTKYLPFFIALFILLLGFLLLTLFMYILKSSEKAHQIAEELLEKYTLATTAARIGTWQWDFNAKVITVDTIMASLLQLPEEKSQLSQEEWEGMFAKSDRDRLPHLLQSASSDRYMKFLIQITNQNNEKMTLRCSGTWSQSESNEEILFGIAWDSTEEYNASESKSEFVSFVAHELRTPLTTVKWIAELFQGEKEVLPEEMREFPEMLQGNCSRMIGLVSTLLNITRIELGKLAVSPEQLSLKPFLEESLSAVDGMAKSKNMTCELILDAVPEFFTADRVLLMIMIQNMLTNGIKYGQNDTKLILRVFPASAGETIGGEHLETNFLVFSVQNRGAGIKKEDAEYIYGKYFRTSTAHAQEGHGLGLYLTSLLVETIKGKVWFTSETDKETTFYIGIPQTGMEKIEGSRNASLS